MKALLLFLLLAPVAEAQNRHWTKPHTWFKSNMSDAEYQAWAEPRRHDSPFKSKVFWTGVLIIGTSIALDAHSTATRPSGVLEHNPFIGPNPSTKRVTGFALGDFGAQFLFHYGAYKLSHNDPSKSWRTIGQWGIPAEVAATSGRAGIRNYVSR